MQAVILVGRLGTRQRTRETLQRFGIASRSAAVITGEDVHRQKPDPDIFTLAASKLCVPAEQALVVEDFVAGVRAARAAGMRCVGYAACSRWEELCEAGASELISEFLPKTIHLFLRMFSQDGPPAEYGERRRATSFQRSK